MTDPDGDDRVRRQLRTLQRVSGNPTDSVLARRSGVAPATFSEVMSGKRRPREEFVTKVISGCLVCARAGGQAPLDERNVLEALRLPGHTAADIGILERDGELNRCSTVLDGAHVRAGGAVVVEGLAGIGKSELLARMCAEAAVRGIVPLSVRGNQRDQTTAFGAVRTLLGRWIAGRGAAAGRTLFAGAAALASVPLGIPQAQRGTPATMIGLTEALYWLVVNATSLVSAGKPDEALLFAVDDAHWLDEESLSWLEYLVDRLAGLPLVVVLAYRPHEPALAPALTRISLRANEIVRLRPLSLEAVRILVDRALGPRAPRRGRVPEPDEAFCAAFLRHSGGNPFYLRWMLEVARERRLPPTATAAGEIGTLTPRHVVVYLNERLGGLGEAARRLAQTIAVLGPAGSLEHAARLAGLSIEDAKREYDNLCRAEILTDQSTMDFCHPIIRGAVYDDIEPSRRSDLHLAAARLLHGRHAGSEAVAAHLLDVLAAADPWVSDRLAAAAADAMAAGLSDTAARYLRRAVDEPPPPGARCRVRLRYGQALALGEVAAAIPELLAAYRTAPDDALRTEAAIALAKTYGYADRLGDSVRLLDSALARCRDGEFRDQLVAEQLLWAAWWADDPDRVDRMRLLDRLVPPLPAEGYVRRLLIVLYAWSLVLRGAPCAAALAAIEPVLRAGVVFPDAGHGMEVATISSFVYLYSDQLTTARSLFDQAIEEFDRDGWRGAHLAFAYTHQGNVALGQGRLADAVADAGIALRLADRTGPGTPAEWFATGTLIQALLARGEIDRAVAVRTRRRYDGPQPDAVALPFPRGVLGALRLAQRDTANAVRILREFGSWLDQVHLTNPAICPWRFDLALALRHSAPEEALEIATTARTQADRFGSPTTRGRALRTLAALQPPTAIPLLEEAARILRHAPNRLEHARALADLGTALARSGHPTDAGIPLTEALTLAAECDAPALHATITHELATIGAPTPPPTPRANTLHPRQRRVAQLAAQGRSEAEIAYTMVLDLTTVTTLLQDAYRTLSATSRPSLRRALT
jgi:tetratricopeptide (TPR) repeat protein